MDARYTAGALSAEARARSLEAANGVTVAPARGRVIAQTYATLGASLLLTALTTGVVMRDPALLAGVARHFWWYVGGSFVLLFMMRPSSVRASTRLPLFGAFSVVEGAAIAPLCAVLEARTPGVLGQAAILTGTAVAALTVAGVVFRNRTAAWGQFLFTGVIVLLVASLLAAFSGGAGSTTMTWLSAAGVFIFSGYLVYDTGRLVDTYWRAPGAYVHCAVALYLDVLNLFLYVAQLLSGSRSDRR
jgi:FtsH-binding integral membrane protein